MSTTSIEWTRGDDGAMGSVWNPTRGCSRISRGCGASDGGGCYAERQAHRFSGAGQPYSGLTRATSDGPRWTGDVRLVPEMLDAPLHWRKPRRIFVNSMSDLFHEKLSNEDIAAVFGVMAGCPQHTFQVLTKRAERMRGWFAWAERAERNGAGWREPRWVAVNEAERRLGRAVQPDSGATWPLPNVWLGVSVEDQASADERIPHLLATPATVRWVSFEPQLAPVDFTRWLPQHVPWSGVDPESWDEVAWPEWVPAKVIAEIAEFWGCSARKPRDYRIQHATNYAHAPPFGVKVQIVHKTPGWRQRDDIGRYVHCWNNIGRVVYDDGGIDSGVATHALRVVEKPAALDLVIVGGESGPGARPFDLAWARSTLAQCRAASVPYFLKQLGRAPFARGGPPNGPSIWSHLRDPKGGDPSEWPEDLRVREMPTVTP